MYTNLLAREQLRTIMCLWNNQQHKIFLASNTVQHYANSAYNNGYTKWDTNPQGTEISIDKFFNIRRFYTVGQQKKVNPTIDKEFRTVRSSVTHHDDDVHVSAPQFSFKHILYGPDHDVTKVLNECHSYQELNQALDRICTKYRKEHLVQTIILLWLLSKETIFVQESKIGRQLLQKTIANLAGYVDTLNLKEMTTCYLYLRKMGLENKHPVVQDLLIQSLREIESTDVIVDLPSLSRLSVGINVDRDFFTPGLCSHFIRHLDYHISACETEDDARLIAICMINLQPIIDDDLMNRYKACVRHQLQTQTISGSTPKTVVKILSMLNMGVWNHKHFALIRELMLSLQPVIKQIDTNDLKSVCRIYQYHMEPATLHGALSEAMENLLSTNLSSESLAYFVPFAQPHKREALINAFKALVYTSNSWEHPGATAQLFSTLRGLKISDTKLCDTYWNGVLSELNLISTESTNTTFLKHCHRYMNFNNNLGGTYRHLELEKRLSQLCMRSIERDESSGLPKKFVRFASFVLAYGHTPFCWKKYPNNLLSKIINMSEQFTAVDCAALSRGLQISLEMRFRHQVPQLIGLQLSTIDSILSECMERFLNSENLSVTDINILVRTLSNMKSLRNSVVYHKILQKYKHVTSDQLNSRTIKDMAYNLMATNYLVPEVLEAMFKYLETNYNNVVGETVDKILTCSYNLGYTPESSDSLHYAGQILLRDFNYMSGLSLVQSCLALCYYKTIPEELINKVFCVKFIQRVEDEIQMCYSKATYPERVLNTVMQLNRSVCLDFPEANVPWFQQNFIEAQISKKTFGDTTFGNDVKTVLTQLLKNDSYIRFNHTTPYGYHIDFVINFDKNKRPVEAPVETTMLDRITKVAILLLKLDSFCVNDLNALKGPDSLKIKHLEMMGYKVLHINEHDWNTKYMKVPGAKTNYLKCLLQISS